MNPDPARTCAVCRRGCYCTHVDPGCGHYGCYGRGSVDCPGAGTERERQRQMYRARHRLVVRRRLLAIHTLPI